MKLTIGIKALNEEHRIAEAIASAIEAARPFNGEVILADCGSVDNTLEIAMQFPIRIVQLANPDEKSCGAGAQLAFQHARGEFFYILDGDMILSPAFLAMAIAYLEQNPQVAGVGGGRREKNLQGQQFQIVDAKAETWQCGAVDRLDGGGLFRVSAIKDVHYFADRNLHSFEEFELGARLRSRGWMLVRVNVLAFEHYGHEENGYRLLLRRLSSGYAAGVGEVLRGTVGKPHFVMVVGSLKHVRNSIIVMLWWLSLVGVLLLPIGVQHKAFMLIVFTVAPIIYLSIRRRSFSLSVYSFVSWNITALGMLVGLFRKRMPPARPLRSLVITNYNEPPAIDGKAGPPAFRATSEPT